LQKIQSSSDQTEGSKANIDVIIGCVSAAGVLCLLVSFFGLLRRLKAAKATYRQTDLERLALKQNEVELFASAENALSIIPSHEVSDETDVIQRKMFDYYLSYKASHSKMQLQPSFVAMSIHDVLAASGYTGFIPTHLDIDGGDEAIAGKVRQSKVLLTYIHDETRHDSRCLVEWNTAISLKMPILCIGDATNCKVNDMRQQIILEHPHLGSCTWISYIDTDRHHTNKHISDWLNTQSVSSPMVAESSKKLPTGKSYHYFISHKKRHSRLAFQPEVLARSFHDVLQCRGFQGFFDVDNPVHTSRHYLENIVKSSCAAVIFLHDETCQSEWCRLEWQLMSEHHLPVLCIVDSSNFNEQDLLAQISTVSPKLQDYLWLELSDANRQAIQERAWTWLDLQIKEQVREGDHPGSPLLPGQVL
jgi:hypothetical protein